MHANVIMVIFWLLAAFLNFRKPNRKATIVAGIVLYCMYAIPHSTMGSQYDYEKGSVEIMSDASLLKNEHMFEKAIFK